MKKISSLIIPLIFLFILTSCSSTQESAKTESTGKDSVYVFDEVPQDTVSTAKDEEPVVTAPSTPAGTYYIVQIGAFTTKEKAETFAEASRKKLDRELIIIYSSTVNLFVVQLTDPFTNRGDAEQVRNELWKTSDFKDAWILTVNR